MNDKTEVRAALDRLLSMQKLVVRERHFSSRWYLGRCNNLPLTKRRPSGGTQCGNEFALLSLIPRSTPKMSAAGLLAGMCSYNGKATTCTATSTSIVKLHCGKVYGYACDEKGRSSQLQYCKVHGSRTLVYSRVLG